MVDAPINQLFIVCSFRRPLSVPITRDQAEDFKRRWARMPEDGTGYATEYTQELNIVPLAEFRARCGV